MMPVMAYNLLQSIELLASAARVFADRTRRGHRGQPRALRVAGRAEPGDVHALAPLIGYDAARRSPRKSATGKTVRQVCEEKAVLPPDQLRAALDARAQTEGGLHGGGGG